MDFPKRYNPEEVESRIRKFWAESDIYKFDPKAEGPIFSVDTPPPYVSSAHLHVGHAMSYSQAEFIVRYKRMQGHSVFYPMGFDDNGLPTERYVEKKYKIDKRKTNRQDFIELCLKETRLGAQTYRELWEALGISVDWDLTYSTIDERSRRTAQRSFLDLFEKGLIVRKNEPITWCYNCDTSLAQADVETMERNTLLNDIAFSAEDGTELVISTTRPELLPACVSLYVNPDDKRYSHLVGTKARVPLFDYEVEIRTHKDVDIEFGTGLMMVCTWGDMEDVIKWKEHNLPTRMIFNQYGKLNEAAGEYANMKPADARKAILAALKEKGLLKDQKQLEQKVGVHERCSTPVEFNMSPQWFIRVLDFKDEFLRRGEELNWYPDHMKVRLEDWVNGLKWDWCISRQRFYGVPFPVWYCKDCGEPWVPSADLLPIDPKVDAVPEGAKCKCGATEFIPEEDVMDTWMTSSLTPLINGRWAYDDEERMRVYPQSIRVQAFEIIRTWLFYTVVKSHFHTDSLPWNDVMISGWGLDEKGQKMSKRLGNFVDPMIVINKYSADALRYWSAGATLGNDLRYTERDVADGKRLMTKLWNASKFVSTYLFDDEGAPLPIKPGVPTLPDQWIVSRFNQVVRDATKYLDRYEYSHALDHTERFFFSEFCDNYLEIVKERFWKPENFTPEQVEAARHTLFTVLEGVLKLFAPFIPYITEELYRIIFLPFGDRPVSIHVSSWPTVDEAAINDVADEAGRLLIAILTSIRRWKTSQQVHAGYPLRSIAIDAPDEVKGKIEPIAEDLRAAARSESLTFAAGGDVAIEGEENIKLAMVLGEKK